VDPDAPQQLRTDAAVIMGSIAKGTMENVNTLVEEGCVSVLIKGTLLQSALRGVSCVASFITIDEQLQ